MLSKIALGLSILALLVVVGAEAGPPAANALKPATPCQPPKFLLQTDFQRTQAVIDDAIDSQVNLPPATAGATTFFVLDGIVKLKPNLIVVNIDVGNGIQGFGFTDRPKTFVVTLSRSCTGDDWKLVSLKEVK